MKKERKKGKMKEEGREVFEPKGRDLLPLSWRPLAQCFFHVNDDLCAVIKCNKFGVLPSSS